jgi:hypothetical protein
MKEIFNWLTVLSGIISATLWFYSSIVKVTIPNVPESDKVSIKLNNLILAGNVNVIRTILLQSKWNTRAAFMSAVTALFQVIAALISPTSN